MPKVVNALLLAGKAENPGEGQLTIERDQSVGARSSALAERLNESLPQVICKFKTNFAVFVGVREIVQECPKMTTPVPCSL